MQTLEVHWAELSAWPSLLPLGCMDVGQFGVKGFLPLSPGCTCGGGGGVLHTHSAPRDRRGCKYPVGPRVPGFPAAVSGWCPVLPSSCKYLVPSSACQAAKKSACDFTACATNRGEQCSLDPQCVSSHAGLQIHVWSLTSGRKQWLLFSHCPWLWTFPCSPLNPFL